MRVTIDQAREAIAQIQRASDAALEPMTVEQRTMLAVSIRHAARVIEAALDGDRVANPHDTDDTSPLGGMVSWILDVSEMLNLPPPDMATRPVAVHVVHEHGPPSREFIRRVGQSLRTLHDDSTAPEGKTTARLDTCSIELYARTADQRDKAIAKCRAATHRLRRLVTRSRYQPPEVQPELWASVAAIADALEPTERDVVLRASTTDDDEGIPF